MPLQGITVAEENYMIGLRCGVPEDDLAALMVEVVNEIEARYEKALLTGLNTAAIKPPVTPTGG